MTERLALEAQHVKVPLQGAEFRSDGPAVLRMSRVVSCSGASLLKSRCGVRCQAKALKLQHTRKHSVCAVQSPVKVTCKRIIVLWVGARSAKFFWRVRILWTRADERPNSVVTLGNPNT